MKVAVIGSSGLMGVRIVRALRVAGVDAIEASKSTGVDVLTGEGLADVFAEAEVVIDVTNTGSFGDGDALSFFKTAGKNLLSAANAADIKHYVVISVVGTDQLVENDYFRAKLVQENLVRSSGVPFTIIRSTQFFEYLGGIIEAAAADGTFRFPPVLLTPLAAGEAADIIAQIALQPALWGTAELGGPEIVQLAILAQDLLTAHDDNRPIKIDPQATYFGVPVAANALLPARAHAIGKMKFHDWVAERLRAY